MEQRPNLEEMFPEEVLELRDEHNVPLPTWYSGPLDPIMTKDLIENALGTLLDVRENAKIVNDDNLPAEF
jgi:hypothetical protein